MDYKEKYEAALKQARKELKICGSMDCDAARLIFRPFPQLRESEDERIRTRLSEYFRGFLEGNEHCYKDGGYVKWEGLDVKSILDWLEKQKEQKPVKKEITLTNFEEVLNTFLFDFANSPIEDCEPKEYTKKHSAEILKAAYTELNAQLKQDIFEAQQEGRREGYEAAKAEQKPAEWSEEDKKIVRALQHALNCADAQNAIAKSGIEVSEVATFLQDLVPHWKPSEEQLVTLKRISGLLKDWGLSKEAKAILMLEGQLANLPMPEKLTESHWKPSEKKVKPPKNVPPIESIMI